MPAAYLHERMDPRSVHLESSGPLRELHPTWTEALVGGGRVFGAVSEGGAFRRSIDYRERSILMRSSARSSSTGLNRMDLGSSSRSRAPARMNSGRVRRLLKAGVLTRRQKPRRALCRAILSIRRASRARWRTSRPTRRGLPGAVKNRLTIPRSSRYEDRRIRRAGASFKRSPLHRSHGRQRAPRNQRAIKGLPATSYRRRRRAGLPSRSRCWTAVHSEPTSSGSRSRTAALIARRPKSTPQLPGEVLILSRIRLRLR